MKGSKHLEITTDLIIFLTMFRGIFRILNLEDLKGKKRSGNIIDTHLFLFFAVKYTAFETGL